MDGTDDDGLDVGRYRLRLASPRVEVWRRPGLGACLRRWLGGRTQPFASPHAADVRRIDVTRRKLWGFESKRPASARPWTVEVHTTGEPPIALAFRRRDEAETCANALRRLVAAARDA